MRECMQGSVCSVGGHVCGVGGHVCGVGGHVYRHIICRDAHHEVNVCSQHVHVEGHASICIPV